MLEIRNVTKVYHSKNGNSVKALDNISVTFPETGMVFILGKSGSGKSTLLNVIGGLDGYDSGEFVIKGKSSKDFANSDFDAYRNTFIGFIFQEYNILDDFTVGANIGLALELQGKKATNEKISAILEQVEMLDYAKRKPNELSGGQKQRIAIARALVKDPEIIMADEPTGALDSNTGKQIFDTLKELSKTKLVIIVSHDRDFAEQYGDRIIEMKDGNILSDVTKHKVAAKSVSDGLLKMSDSLLRIEKGYQLTLQDLELINAYLREQPAEILVSGDSRINTGVRNTAGISADNTSAVFKDTDEKNDVKVKEYDKKQTKFIRSRLPFKNAFKIGSSSLGHKKFRLVVTILLSLIAFALFGFADTLGAYDKIVATTDSIMDSNVKNASFSLGLKHTYSYPNGERDDYSYFNSAAMNDDDIKSLSDKTGMKFIPVFNGTAGEGWGGGKINISGMMASTDKIGAGTAYTGELYGFTVLTSNDVSSLGFNLTGKMPTEKDEIVITKFMCDEFNLTGFTNIQHNEKISADNLQIDTLGGANSIIGKHFTIQMNGMIQTFKICGVIDTAFDTQRYAEYIPSDNNQQSGDGAEAGMDIMGMMMQLELENTLEYGFHALGYIHSEKLSEMAENMRNYMGGANSVGSYMNGWSLCLRLPSDQNAHAEMMGVVDGMGYIDMGWSQYINRVGTSADIESLKGVEFFDGRTTKTLKENEMLVPDSVINNMSSDSNVTDKVVAALTALYGSEAAQRADGQFDMNTLLTELPKEQYINALTVTDENREILKKKQYQEDTGIWLGDEPLPEGVQYSDEQLLNILKDRYLSGDWYEIPNLKDEWTLRREAVRNFVAAFYGETFNSEYSDSFYETLMYAIFSKGDGYYLSKESFMDITITKYAYDAVYNDKIGYTSDDFFNTVMENMYGGQKPTEDYVISKEEAAGAYSEYIRNRTYDDVLEIYGDKRRADFEKDAMNAFKAFTGFSPISLLEGAYLEHSTWDEDGEKITKLDGYKVVGTFEATNGASELIISDTLYAAYQAYVVESGMSIETVAPHEPGIYAFAIAPMPTDRDTVKKLVEISYDESGDYRFSLQNQVTNTLGSFNEFIEVGAMIFLYIGIGFAVFSALMLMNFISVSISYKRREIGILRAVGARSSDVFKIFFSEAFLIALINCVLSIAATVAATIFFNNLVRGEGLNVTLLHFGIRQVVLMLVISVFVAAVASFLPVWNIARRKPVDAIKTK